MESINMNDVQWRVDAMRQQIRPSGPDPFPDGPSQYRDAVWYLSLVWRPCVASGIRPVRALW